MNYAIQTNIVLRGSYALGDGAKILAIEPEKQMHDHDVPHHYEAVIVPCPQ